MGLSLLRTDEVKAARASHPEALCLAADELPAKELLCCLFLSPRDQLTAAFCLEAGVFTPA